MRGNLIEDMRLLHFTRKDIFLIVFFIFLSCSIFFSNVLVSADTKPISKGTQFPNLSFKDSLSKEEQAYLGMSQKNSFSFKKIPGTLFLFEIFSTYCTSCPKNVPILNNVYSRIENDTKLKGKANVRSWGQTCLLQFAEFWRS